MKRLSYNEAITRIEDILSRIDTQQIDVDALAGQVAEARKLVKHCQAMLRKAEDDLNQGK